MDLTKIKCIITDFDKTLYSNANWNDSKNYYIQCLIEKKLIENNEDKINELVKKYPNLHTVQLIYHVAREHGILDKEIQDWFSNHIYDFTCEGMKILDAKLMKKLCKKFPVYILSDSCEAYINRYLKLFKFNKKWFAGCLSNDYKSENMSKIGLMRKVVEENDLQLDEVIMIGDGIRSDIIPAQKLGIQYFNVEDVRQTEEIFKELIKTKEVNNGRI